MRFIMTGTLLCVLASNVLAEEHYVEIWNPPEAHQPDQGKKPHAHHPARHKLALADHLAPRRVAEPAARRSGPASIPNGASGKNARTLPKWPPVLAPQIGPGGNVLQVSYPIPARSAR